MKLYILVFWTLKRKTANHLANPLTSYNYKKGIKIIKIKFLSTKTFSELSKLADNQNWLYKMNLQAPMPIISLGML